MGNFSRNEERKHKITEKAMARILSVLLCLCLLGGINAAAEAPDGSAANALDEILGRGVIRVGTAGDYKPMSFLDPETGAYWGFDTALAEDLAAALGLEIAYVPTSWPTLMEDTLAGKFDLAICGITITDARKEQALILWTGGCILSINKFPGAEKALPSWRGPAYQQVNADHAE